MELFTDQLEHAFNLVDGNPVLHADGVHFIVLTSMNALLTNELFSCVQHFWIVKFAKLPSCGIHDPAFTVGDGGENGVHPVSGPRVVAKPVAGHVFDVHGKVNVTGYNLVVTNLAVCQSHWVAPK